MRTFKRIIALLMAAALILALAACGSEAENTGTVVTESTTSDEREVKTQVAALFGPTGMGLAKLKEDRGYGYTVEYYSDPQEVVPLIVQGKVDIAALPLNLAANLYKKTQGGIQILAINTLGILHVLQRGDKTVKSIADLKGKTIYATGEGATPQYTLDYILEKNGLDPKTDVNIVYLSTHGELATKAAEGGVDLCVLPEPFASKVVFEHEEWSEVLDITEEWNKVSSAKLALGCIVARREYVEKNPDIISEFMTFNEVSVNWVNSSISAGYLLIKHGYFEDYDLAMATIPGCNIVFISGEEMKSIAEENFAVLYEAAPESVGGSVPDEGIYYLG